MLKKQSQKGCKNDLDNESHDTRNGKCEKDLKTSLALGRQKTISEPEQSLVELSWSNVWSLHLTNENWSLGYFYFFGFFLYFSFFLLHFFPFQSIKVRLISAWVLLLPRVLSEQVVFVRVDLLKT